MGVSFGSISKPTQADRRGSVLAPHEPVQAGTPLRSVSEKGARILSCRSVFVRPAGLLPGSLMAHRSRQLASLHSVQGAHPLRRSAVIPLTSLHRFLPAGHAKHGAMPSGVFDWTQSGQSGAWGTPNKRVGMSKRISPLIACLRYRKFLTVYLAILFIKRAGTGNSNPYLLEVLYIC